ncbi:MAG: protein-glutamate O-methyltransferase CheR [Pseudomonadota bacterium]
MPINTQTLTADHFEHLKALVEKRAGLSLQDSKRLMVSSRVAKRLRALSIEDFETYLDFVKSENGKSEYTVLIGVLTTNVTSFFREQHHFDDFRDHVIPCLKQKAFAGEAVRIWSAGCSIGAEPYSLALLLQKQWPDIESYDVRILATDIDPAVLRQAHEARYPRELLIKEIPTEYRDQIINQKGEYSTLSERIRNLVTVKSLNLVGDWPLQKKFDAVFCRNVVIYFSKEITRSIWMRFANQIHEGGRLYVGHSERVAGPAEAEFRSVGVTVYEKTGRAS